MPQTLFAPCNQPGCCTDLDVRIINAITGELPRDLTTDTSTDYQPQTQKKQTPEPTTS